MNWLLKKMWAVQLAAFGFCLTALAALAQATPGIADGGIFQAGTQPVFDPNNPSSFLGEIGNAVMHKQWWVAAGMAVSVLTWFIHSPLASKLPAAVQTFLGQPLVNFATPIVLSIAGGLFSTLGMGGPIDWPTFAATVLKTAGTAAFSFLFVKNAAEQLTKAQTAGTAAAAAVNTQSAARDELKK